ncbi:unnamed protein product [Bathycoccus prasinos]
MDRGFLVGPSFFIDHFPDTAAAVLSAEEEQEQGEHELPADDQTDQKRRRKAELVLNRMRLPKGKAHIASDLDHLVDDDV